MRNLRQGSRGADVRELQQQLADMGYDVGPIDGIFGPQTRAAVVRAQRDLGVAADGVVGPQTRAAMQGAAPAGGSATPQELLRRGARGDAVRQMQQQLADMGYDVGPIDGIFGPRTEAALRRAQQDLGVTSDGVFGPETRGAFERGAEEGFQRPQTPEEREQDLMDLVGDPAADTPSPTPEPPASAQPPSTGEVAPDPAEIARQQREANRQSLMATISWLPSELVDIYINEYVKTGQSELAWAMVRQSPVYDQHFAGNRRADGSLRMNEQDYLSHRDAFERSLRQWGLNPELFMGRHAQLVEGEVSAAEFGQRIEAKVTGLLQNLPEIRERYGQFYGIDQLTDEALIAAALDPDVGLAVLEGRLTAAQISGEAQRFGFERGREASERIGQQVGFDQLQAREFYSGAAQVVPRMGRLAERFDSGRGGFGIEQYEEAGLFGDTELQRRMRRLHASEMSMFRQGGQIAMDPTGAMTGLRRR